MCESVCECVCVSVCECVCESVCECVCVSVCVRVRVYAWSVWNVLPPLLVHE